MARISPRILAALVAVAALRADQKKLTLDQKVELLRGLTSEYATVKHPLPRSKKALELNSDGTFDKDQWAAVARQMGPAGRVGDLVQITHVAIEKNSILFEINHGMKSQGSWKDHVQVGIGGNVAPISRSDANAPAGTSIILKFPGEIGELTSTDVKKMMAPVLDFDKHTATGNYVDTLPPEIKQAILDKKPVEGMDRDQVLLALGRPLRKSRENKDGVDYEDWIYGQPPGRVTFVTFAGPKVAKIKETYAGLGGSIAESPKQP
ncbi:MAG TPA: hypothetical protein VMT15_16155 [Bryobacteraceae bacterium]|nr:hypothetical protein [Bryobacteraceae bacterium]